MKREKNALMTFLIGITIMAAGFYWFTSSVTVASIGLYSWRIGRIGVGGMVVVPFIVGVCWIFANPDSIGAKILLTVGLIVIIASIIAGTQLIFRSRNLYEYLIMLIMMFGGATLTLKTLLAKPKS